MIRSSVFHPFFRFSLVLFLGTLALSRSHADVRLPGLFSDHMVLQQNKELSVWGWADDGEEVRVTFRGIARKVTARDGAWRVTLPKQKAGGPDELKVEGKNRIVLQDVLVGEVWVCSGQSNMQWPMKLSFQPKADIDAATNPQIRLFTVPQTKAATPLEDVKSKWQRCSPEAVTDFSAVAYYFGRDLQRALKVPVGLINTSWGGSPAEAWMSKDVLESNETYQREILESYAVTWKNHHEAMAKYREQEAALKKEGKNPAQQPPQAPFWKPSELYNGMIHPLLPFSIAGVIWYQGESNASRAYQYRALFADLIKNWRSRWDQGDFPFLAVQLAPWDKNKKRSLEQITATPGESDWAELREAQNYAAELLKNVGVAVITDAGDKDDIHPANKETVGKRLALLARKIAYGHKVAAQGPTFKSLKIRGDKVVLTFDNVGDGLVSRDGDLKGFAIAGIDGRFVWAKAVIVGKNTVEVSSPRIKEPYAVRYGWADFPVVNLWNKEGLPASPFRTDDFPLTTKPKP